MAVDEGPKLRGGLDLNQYRFKLGLLEVDDLIDVVGVASIVLRSFGPQI